MKIKIKKIAPKHKNKYVIEVDFMHGDADAYTTEEFVCANENEFERIMKQEQLIPQSPGSGGDEDAYRAWCTELFGEDFVPSDCTCDDIQASVESFAGFYYNEAGVKFEASL
jgi:hypothetical protein